MLDESFRFSTVTLSHCYMYIRPNLQHRFLAQINFSIRNIFCVYEVIFSHFLWLWTDPPQDAENITLIMAIINLVINAVFWV